MTLVCKLPNVTLTDNSLPILYRDVMINAGTKLLFDFKSTFCFAKQAAPVLNDAFVNLVPGAPGASVTLNTGGAGLGFSGGGVTFNAANPGAISLGTSYDLTGTGPSILVVTWLKLPTGFNTSAPAGVVGAAQNSSTSDQWSIDFGSAPNPGQAPAATIGFSGGSTKSQVANPLTLNVPHQFAFSWAANGTGCILRTFLDGAEVGTPVNGIAGTNLFISSPDPLTIGKFGAFNPPSMTFYRLLLENLTVSGKDPLAQVVADYAANTGRFT